MYHSILQLALLNQTVHTVLHKFLSPNLTFEVREYKIKPPFPFTPDISAFFIQNFMSWCISSYCQFSWHFAESSKWGAEWKLAERLKHKLCKVVRKCPVKNRSLGCTFSSPEIKSLERNWFRAFADILNAWITVKSAFYDGTSKMPQTPDSWSEKLH